VKGCEIQHTCNPVGSRGVLGVEPDGFGHTGRAAGVASGILGNIPCHTHTEVRS
jgi:hypothetical protein